VKIGQSYKVYPTLTTGLKAEMLYIRTPKTPKWTYNTIQNPVYNVGASDRQDIELDESMFVPLITKNPSILWSFSVENDIVCSSTNRSSKRTKKS
jgi:hypothetical protein